MNIFPSRPGILFAIVTLFGVSHGQETRKAEERVLGEGAVSAPHKGAPVKRDLLLQVLRQRSLEERDVLGVIQRNGVDFTVDSVIEKELAAAGAKPNVIAAAKANNRARPAAAAKPAPKTVDQSVSPNDAVPEEEADLLSDIPSVGGTVTSFRFFTADDDLPPPRGSRKYETRFAKAALKTVYYEFSVLYLTDNSSTFNMTVIWMRNGQQLARQDLPFTKPRDWATGTRTYGHGFATPGLWDTGKYEVVVEVDGRKVAANMFEVY